MNRRTLPSSVVTREFAPSCLGRNDPSPKPSGDGFVDADSEATVRRMAID